jgi:hypothetical protein
MEGSSRNGFSWAEGFRGLEGVFGGGKIGFMTGRTGQAVEAPAVDQCHQPHRRQQSPI